MVSIQQITETKNFKKWVIVIFFAISALTWFCLWLYNHHYASTDDAYINANMVQVAPRVTGKINHLFVRNNQYVKQGDVLFELDQEPFQLAMNVAKAELELSIAEFDHADLTRKRTIALVTKHFQSPQEGDNTIANFKTAAARVEQAKAHLSESNLNLQYTLVRAPTNGFVTNATLREGDMVAANQPVFVIISNDEYWIDANFKETEMRDIHLGQSAKVESDMYPGQVFDGIVESISHGAGSAFSLLPPQNATGNWVKVTQRVPVRIRILHPDPHYPLRIGTSASVTVNLKSLPTKKVAT